MKKALKKALHFIKAKCKNAKEKYEIKHIKKNTILPMAPIIINGEHINEYLKRIHAAIKNKELNNISITGNYGTGKSSLIKTYLKKLGYRKTQYVKINIASYFEAEETLNQTKDKNQNEDQTQNDSKFDSKESGNNKRLERSEIELVNNIEIAILRQLLFRNTNEEMPDSNIKRVTQKQRKQFNVFTIGYLVYFCFIKLFINYYENNTTMLKFSMIDYLTKYNSITIDIISKIIVIILVVFLFISFINVINLIVNAIFYGIKSIRINFHSNELTLEHDDELAFSKNLREIIMFFTYNHKCKLVVFEDIDRFPNDVTLKLVEELKQLNLEINNSNSVSQNVTFIYSFKDSIFDKIEDKSKFYDYNISVMPVSSYYNSGENLNDLLTQCKVTNYPSENILDILSNKITDIRTLITIINDYNLFCDVLKTDQYDKVFGISIVKNFYFKEYENILTHDNFIDEKFKSIDNKRKEIIEKIKQKNQKLTTKKENIESEITKSMRETKQLFWLNCISSDLDYYSYVRDRKSGNTYNYKSFISNNFDIELLRENKLIKSNGEEINYDYFGGKDIFLERLEDTKENRIKKIQSEILDNNIKINMFEIMNDAEVYREYVQGAKDYDLLDELIANSYIERDYVDYITAPSSSGLTGADNKFIFDVKHKSYSFETPISHPELAVKRLKNNFDSPYILNLNMLEYIKDKEYIKIVANQYKRLDSDKIQFLKLLKTKKFHLFNDFIKTILDMKIDLWDQVNDIADSEYIEMIFEAIIYTDNGISYVDNYKSFINYANLYFNNKESAYFFPTLLSPTVQNNIMKYLKHKIRINDISNLPDIIKSFVLNSGSYEFNNTNIKALLDFIPDNLDSVSVTMLHNGKIHLKNIEENFQTFFDEYYNENDVKINNIDIIKNILKQDLTITAKKEIYKREIFQLKLDDIEEELYPWAIKFNHIIPSWTSVFKVKDKIEEHSVYQYIYKNKDILFNKNLLEKEYRAFENQFVFIGYILNNLFLNKYYQEAQNINDCILSKYEHKYGFIGSFCNKAIETLCKWDKLDYKLTTFKKIYKMNLELAQEYLNNWTNNSHNHLEIYKKLKCNNKYVVMLLQSEGLSNEERIEYIIKEKATTEITKKLIRSAFPTNTNIEIKYRGTYKIHIFENDELASMFSNCHITNKTITFSLK